MGYVNFPYRDEDDIFPESNVEDQELDQHNHENDRVRQHYPRTERAVWLQQGPRTPPQWPLFNRHLALPPGNLWIPRPAAPARQQPRSRPPYNLHRCLARPPPIGVSIPIEHWPHRDPRQGISLRFRSGYYPLQNNLVQNRALFDRRRLLVRNIPPPMPLQLRSPNSLSFQFCMRRQLPRWRNRIPRSPYPGRLRPPAIKIARRPSSYLMRRSQVSFRRHQCIMNIVELEITEEEEDGKDMGEPRDRCEAYKDLHYDKDRDDDDDDFNSNNQAFPNMQVVL